MHWHVLITGGLGALIGTIVAAVAVRRAVRVNPAVDAKSGQAVLKHGNTLKLGGSFMLLFTSFLSYCLICHRPKDVGNLWALVALIVVFGVGGIGILIEAIWGKVCVSPSGVRACSLWRRSGRCIAWKDISKVSFSHYSNCFEIRAKSGIKIHASTSLLGIRVLVEAIRGHVPPQQCRDAAEGFRLIEGR